jgi:hypothetical protein
MRASSEPATLMDIEVPDSWPNDLLAYLNRHHRLFLDWETGARKVTASTYDRAIYGLRDVLQPYAINGWHCTRLTKAEIATIISTGMQLPDGAMLNRRIDALLNTGSVTESVANRLKRENQSHASNRAGMIWFCFFPPRLAGEHGIEGFFRHWGGEALYNSHENDPETGVAINSIGVPSLVEADVPIASLESHGGLDFKVVRRFLIHRGYQTREPVEHEDRIKRPLPAENVRRVISFPEPDFMRLTSCDAWSNPVG